MLNKQAWFLVKNYENNLLYLGGWGDRLSPGLERIFSRKNDEKESEKKSKANRKKSPPLPPHSRPFFIE